MHRNGGVMPLVIVVGVDSSVQLRNGLVPVLLILAIAFTFTFLDFVSTSRDLGVRNYN